MVRLLFVFFIYNFNFLFLKSMPESTNYTWRDKLFLIVEDDPASSMLLEIILTKTGAKLLFAENGEKAIEIVKRTRGIDLVLMDIKMDGINGIQAATLIKKISPNLPIIAQTACVVYGDKEQCIQAGCSAYITKPIITEVLLEVIDSQFSFPVSKKNYQDRFSSN